MTDERSALQLIAIWGKLELSTMCFPQYLKFLIKDLVPTDLNAKLDPSAQIGRNCGAFRQLQKGYDIIEYLVSIRTQVKHGSEVVACVLSSIEEILNVDLGIPPARNKCLNLQFHFLSSVMQRGDGTVVARFDQRKWQTDSWKEPLEDVIDYLFRKIAPKVVLKGIGPPKFTPSDTVDNAVSHHMSSTDPYLLKDVKLLTSTLATDWLLSKYRTKITKERLSEDLPRVQNQISHPPGGLRTDDSSRVGFNPASRCVSIGGSDQFISSTAIG